MTPLPLLSLLLAVLIAGLVGFRLARALAEETIGLPIRRRVHGWAYPPLSQADPEEWIAPRHRAREWVEELLTCAYCLGFWISAATCLVLTAQLTDAPVVAHLAAAVAAGGFQSYLVDRERPVEVELDQTEE